MILAQPTILYKKAHTTVRESLDSNVNECANDTVTSFDGTSLSEDVYDTGTDDDLFDAKEIAALKNDITPIKGLQVKNALGKSTHEERNAIISVKHSDKRTSNINFAAHKVPCET